MKHTSPPGQLLRRTRLRRPLGRSLLVALILGPVTQAQSLPAGTRIVNQGQISGTTLGQPISSVSNAVVTSVLPLCGVSLTPNGTVEAPGQQYSLLPGEQTVLTYQVNNTGNTPATYPLTVLQSGEGSGSVQVYVDRDGDGRFSQADAPASEVTLEMNAARTVFVLFRGEQPGATYVNLIASCADQRDENNVSLVTVGQPPAFDVSKTFDREVLRPGDKTTVSISVTNRGQGASREVQLLDDLFSQPSSGLVFVPGSARSSMAPEYSADGAAWQTEPPASVRAVRVTKKSLQPGETLSLSFQLQATASAEGRSFTNVAQVVSPAAGGQVASDTIEVRYSPGVRIGPAGQPLAEGSADRQFKPFALTTGEVCFDHTVRNTGDVADAFTLSVTYPAGRATPSFRSGGAPLAQPVALEPGASLPVQVCYSGLATGPFEATVSVQGKRGTSDPTTDAIGRVETRLPELQKTVSRPGTDWQPGQRVETGQELLYTLRVINPYAAPLEGLTLTDVLPRGTELIEAPGASADGNRLTWQIASLGAGETRELKVRVRVSASEDDQELSNVFSLTSPLFPEGLVSNAAKAYVWNSVPNITKVSLEGEVGIGDRVTYRVTVFNTSKVGTLTNVVLIDTPSAGLQYVPGTSRLGGQPLADPVITKEAGQTVLRWGLPDLLPDTSAQVSYQMLVTPQANGQVRNTARLRAVGAAGATAVASESATRINVIALRNFAPIGDILGRVFIDTDGNRLASVDEPGVAGARVLLAGGRSVITDSKGRYHFGNVPFGAHALRLDPASVQADPARPGLTQSVQVMGLTTVNFPLPTNASSIGRAVPVELSGLSGQKLVWPVQDGYRIQISVVAQRNGFLNLQDPLPTGAKLSGSQAAWSGVVQAGQRIDLEYRVTYGGSLTPLLGAPQSGWKE